MTTNTANGLARFTRFDAQYTYALQICRYTLNRYEEKCNVCVFLCAFSTNSVASRPWSWSCATCARTLFWMCQAHLAILFAADLVFTGLSVTLDAFQQDREWARACPIVTIRDHSPQRVSAGIGVCGSSSFDICSTDGAVHGAT